MTSLEIKPKNSDLEADTIKPLRLNEWRTTDKKKKSFDSYYSFFYQQICSVSSRQFWMKDYW